MPLRVWRLSPDFFCQVTVCLDNKYKNKYKYMKKN